MLQRKSQEDAKFAFWAAHRIMTGCCGWFPEMVGSPDIDTLTLQQAASTKRIEMHIFQLPPIGSSGI
jgi:hypothetical protein